MSFQQTTDVYCPALQIGWLTGLDLTCTLQPIEESGKMVRTWNGTLINLTPPEFRQYRIVLSSAGDALPPALADLWPGAEIAVAPPVDFLGTALAGRTVHSTRTVDARGVVVPKTGYTQLSPTRTFRRYQFACLVTEPWTVSHRDSRKELSWTLTCEEKQAPAGA